MASKQPNRHFRDELHPGVRDGQYIAQRIGWLLIAAVIVLALLGLFGDGPLSRAKATSSSEGISIELEYQRFARSRSPQELRVTIDAPNATADTVAVAFSDRLASGVQITGTSPEGATGAFVSDAALAWRIDDWTQPIEITIEYIPRARWRFEGAITVIIGETPGREVSFTQFLYP